MSKARPRPSPVPAPPAREGYVLPVGAPADARFISCPGNEQPWGKGHAFPVFLEVAACKNGKVRSVHVTCKICGWKGFLYGPWWLRNGVTRAWLRVYSPLAVDGAGLPINPR